MLFIAREFARNEVIDDLPPLIGIRHAAQDGVFILPPRREVICRIGMVIDDISIDILFIIFEWWIYR